MNGAPVEEAGGVNVPAIELETFCSVAEIVPVLFGAGLKIPLNEAVDGGSAFAMVPVLAGATANVPENADVAFAVVTATRPRKDD